MVNIAWPIHRKNENKSSPFLAPILSRRIPPKRGRIVLGKAYAEYSIPYDVAVIFNSASI